MSFIDTVPEEQADGLLQELYEMDKKANGYLPNYAKVFSLNPDAYAGWKKLISAPRGRMRLRRYELLTFATAMAMGCTY